MTLERESVNACDEALSLETLTAAHEDRWLAAVEASRALHKPWVRPPATPAEFSAHLEKYSEPNQVALVATRGSAALIGCIHLNEITRGALQSAYLGYYVFTPHAGAGHMKIALRLACELAFTTLGLHRLEANIQPDNHASIGLVQRLGFRQEGFSPRYLHIGGAWRDHLRFAITAEELIRFA